MYHFSSIAPSDYDLNVQLSDLLLPLKEALTPVPAGNWGIGVSGGADSVALLRASLAARPDLTLHVIHLDHQARGQQSAEDARFVERLAASLKLPSTISRLDQLPPESLGSRNISARFRQARVALFQAVAKKHQLRGVLLAHHANDQAETILQRLLRGAGPAGVCGMRVESRIGSLTVFRPLLGVCADTLRGYLTEIGQPWREDPSNASDRYQRNRLRFVLQTEPMLRDRLLELGQAAARLNDWYKAAAPRLPEVFGCQMLSDLPAALGRESARQWLAQRGSPAGELTRVTLDRLRALASDLASPHAQMFPGNICVRRRAGKIFAEPSP